MKAIIAMMATPPTEAPTLIPMVAPWDRPPLSLELEDDSAGEVVVAVAWALVVVVAASVEVAVLVEDEVVFVVEVVLVVVVPDAADMKSAWLTSMGVPEVEQAFCITS